MERTADRLVAMVGVALAFGFAGIAIGAQIVDDDAPTASPAAAGATAATATEAGSAHAHTADTAAAPDDLGLSKLQNGHHDQMTLEELDAATQAELDAQLAVTRETAARYPTIADAEKAGYHRAGPYTPGLGVHYVTTTSAALNADGAMDREDLLEPLALIYDGLEPDSELAGFMYYSLRGDTPEGFAGSNDFWHFHTNICIVTAPDGTIDSPLGADREATPEQCVAFKGQMLQQTQYMVHVWTVPGYEVSDADGGVFAEVNPKLKCADGTYHLMPESDWVDHPLNFCRSELA